MAPAVFAKGNYRRTIQVPRPDGGVARRRLIRRPDSGASDASSEVFGTNAMCDLCGDTSLSVEPQRVALSGGPPIAMLSALKIDRLRYQSTLLVAVSGRWVKVP